MIVTLTPNPSVDRTIAVDGLERGAVQRATATREDPGGKGINVTRALVANGCPSLAVLPEGGSNGHVMAALLAEAATPHRAVPVREAIRANVALVEPDGTTTKINEPGPTLSPDEVEALLLAVTATLADEVSWVVVSGSLPPGMSDGIYADLVRMVRGAGARVAIDTSGTSLVAAVAAGPNLVKPNRVELGELVGRDLSTLGDVVEAARALPAAIDTVLVSLGRDGAVLVTADAVVHAAATVDAPMSTVGAGDCTLAGFLAATERGEPAHVALSTAVAFGAAAVALPGSAVPTPDQVAAVSVTTDPDPDPSRTLTD